MTGKCTDCKYWRRSAPPAGLCWAKPQPEKLLGRTGDSWPTVVGEDGCEDGFEPLQGQGVGR